MKDNLYIVSDEEIKGHKEDIRQYIIGEIINQLRSETDTENLVDNLRNTADILELIEENEEGDIILLKYNPMGAWYEAEVIQEEYIQEVSRLYNEHLERTENRNPSYGEYAYIYELDKNGLDELYNELLEEEQESGEK